MSSETGCNYFRAYYDHDKSSQIFGSAPEISRNFRRLKIFQDFPPGPDWRILENWRTGEILIKFVSIALINTLKLENACVRWIFRWNNAHSSRSALSS
jgi:hypothetical protein